MKNLAAFNSKISLQKGKLVVRVPKGALQDEAGTETGSSENIEIVIENFIETVDKFRSPHLWRKVDGVWQLRHTVWDNSVEN